MSTPRPLRRSPRVLTTPIRAPERRSSGHERIAPSCLEVVVEERREERDERRRDRLGGHRPDQRPDGAVVAVGDCRRRARPAARPAGRQPGWPAGSGRRCATTCPRTSRPDRTQRRRSARALEHDRLRHEVPAHRTGRCRARSAARARAGSRSPPSTTAKKIGAKSSKPLTIASRARGDSPPPTELQRVDADRGDERRHHEVSSRAAGIAGLGDARRARRSRPSAAPGPLRSRSGRTGTTTARRARGTSGFRR